MSEQNANSLVEGSGIGQMLGAKSAAHPALKGLAELSVGRQLGLMVSLALSVAIGVAVVMWSQTPSYSRLFAELGESDVAEVLQVLDTEGIKYKVETGSGAIMVPTDAVHELKLKLAALGLPKSNSLGYELLDKDQGFGASKSTEMVRFQRALEGEIAQTIMSIQSVKSARVLLALPVQSVFVRDRKKPSASVIVNLHQGRSLDKGQIEAIVHLVSSSVPQLDADQVTVVDQKGRLLNSKDSSAVGYLTSKQFEYKKNIEEHLMERISNILAPLVGEGMRVQLSADVDFTETDKTQELFNPQNSALRSEQVSEEKNTLSPIQGVPGALSNQPTPAGSAPETPKPDAANAANNTASSTATQVPPNAKAANPDLPASQAKNSTRNFELDKTITHTRLATGELRRLSVAVVVDDKHVAGTDGKVKNQAYNQADLDRLTELVKQAVGFNAERGDQVTVTNVAFKAPEDLGELPKAPLWEQGWFIELMKQVAAGLAVLFLIFGVLRPTMRTLAGRTLVEERKALGVVGDEDETPLLGEDGQPIEGAAGDSAYSGYDQDGTPIGLPGTTEDELAELPAQIEDLLLLDVPPSYEKRLEYLQRVVDNDPKIIAQIVKKWVR